MYSFIAVGVEVRTRLEKAVEDLLLRPKAHDTLGQVRTTAIVIVSEVLRRLSVNTCVGSGSVLAPVPQESGDGDMGAVCVVPDNGYRPGRGERVGFLGTLGELVPPTREEIRAKIDAEELVPVCPNCGKTIGEEVDGA